MKKTLKAGDFTNLANDYSKNRPDYSPTVLKSLLGLLSKPISKIDFVDVGAGTGIWTRMVYKTGVNSVKAVEPNEQMRLKGIEDCNDKKINWVAGGAESTSLPVKSADWLTMASSFHWADFQTAIKEFWRVLRPNGCFTALWNPRLIEVSNLFLEIEGELKKLQPKIKRVSSGRSGITETLSDDLSNSQYFEDVIYVEGRHVVKMSTQRYLGAWRSVNDLRVQLGPQKFDEFLSFVEKKISNLDMIEATYITRAWTARRKG